MEKPILLYSTNLKAEPVTFSEALLKGLAPDKGLFMPEFIPTLSAEEIESFSSMEYYEIAFTIGKKFLKSEISDADLLAIVKDAYDYAIPLEKAYDNKYVMRLDQGPTASFKDFAARMMARLMNYYLARDGRKMLILTATSGDTGSAVANAFYGLNNIKVVVLFPTTEVTPRQRKQMTTLGKNVTVLSLDGKFDDCQALVKEAFSDSDLDYLGLSSANSINIGRLVPQIMYYAYSYSRLKNEAPDKKIVFSVPSGNFGDMMGGVLAMKMGIPIKKFVIATNKNDVFPNFMKTGEYHKIEPSHNCISSAMNVGHPSNMSRLVALYGGIMDEKGNVIKMPDMELMNKEIFSVSVSDSETEQTIKQAWEEHKLLLEPHGAVGWKGLISFLNENPSEKNSLCVSLETAHPAKFPEKIIDLLNFDPKLPPSLEGLDNKPEFVETLENNYVSFKKFLMERF
ncbi:MAG: threonine synthase [Bacteroidales bacterium]|nr:threonine synthase [Bacteroidales bacterium]